MIANFITGLRIILSITLIFFKLDNTFFIILYSICGITDILDGYIARKTKTESRFGAKIDSIADLFFGIVIIKILYPIIVSNELCLIWIIAIGIMKLISLFVIFNKYKTFAIIHTYLNKVTGLLIFLSPYFMVFLNKVIILYLVCFIATITAIEELCINLKSTKLEINKKQY